MKTILSIVDDKFLINDKMTYSEIAECPKEYHGLLMNSRMIQGVFDDKFDTKRYNRFGKKFNADENTDNLVNALPLWYTYGLRAITVGFQGGGPCYTINNQTINNNPFSNDGKIIDTAYLSRMKRIIEAADKIGMVVIVSYFYNAQTRFIKDDTAVIEAVKSASNWLRDEKFTNVIIEIANEHDAGGFKNHPILFTEQGIADLIDIARRESGGMPVGCSGTGGYFSEVIANASDVILIHGNSQSRGHFYNLIKKSKAIKPVRPIVCNEDSQAISQMEVSFHEGISWGYYNNMTKQEPPADFGITKGEDYFFAIRMAEFLGIKKTDIKEEDQYYIQGFEENMTYDGKRWIRLASLYPEKINYVEFYRNGKIYETSYDSPFMINYVGNWLQQPVMDIKDNEEWEAVIHLIDGRKISKKVK